MDISSMMSLGVAASGVGALHLDLCSHDRLRREWRVWPSTLNAATPVGAATSVGAAT